MTSVMLKINYRWAQLNEMKLNEIKLNDLDLVFIPDWHLLWH